MQVSLLPCEFCGRTFTSTALAHHAKVCTAASPMKAPGAGEVGTGGAGSIASLLPCQFCGRTFTPTALASHAKSCNASSPTKRPPSAAPGVRFADTAVGSGGGGAAAGGPSMRGSFAHQSAGGGGAPGGDAVSARGSFALRSGGGGGTPSGGDAAPPSASAGAAQLSKSGSFSFRTSRQQPEVDLHACLEGDALFRTGSATSPRSGGGSGGGAADSYNRAAPSQFGRSPSVRSSAQYDAGGGYGGGAYGGGAADGAYGSAGGGDDAGGASDLCKCPTCGRSFNAMSYTKHVGVCQKVFASKRKTFNSTAHRLAGTGAAVPGSSGGSAMRKSVSRPSAMGGRPASARAGSSAAAAPGGSAVPRWKAQSSELRAAMRATQQINAALARGEDLRNIPHVRSAPDPSFVQCPTCGRRFNGQAAERHIPLCKNIVAKPKFLRAGTGGAGAGSPQYGKIPGTYY